MPSSLYISFDAPPGTRLTPRRVHAAWGHVLDLPAGLTPERAATHPTLAHRPPHSSPTPKPYAIGQVTSTSHQLGFELRVLDDRLLDTLEAWLAWGGVLPLGDGGPTTPTAIAVDAQLLQQTTWQDIAATTQHTSWTVTLQTPTVLTSHGRHHTNLEAASIATSLHARWRQHSPTTCPHLPDRHLLEHLLTTVDHTQVSTISLGMPHDDGRGRLASRSIQARTGSLRVTGRPDATTAVFSQLMALASYTNVGSHSAYGMGALDVVPDPA